MQIFNTAGENIRVKQHLGAMNSAINELTGHDYQFFMTLTPAYVTTQDTDFIKMTSSVIIRMNEYLYTSRYGDGKRGNGKRLRGWAFLERQEKRAMFDKLVEATTGAPVTRTKKHTEAPLHVHMIIEALDTDGDAAEQMAQLRDAMYFATDSVRREKRQTSCTARQKSAIEKACREYGRDSNEAKARAKRASTTPCFNPKGIDLRRVFDATPLVGYLCKQLDLYTCQMNSFDFVVPIESNGLPTAVSLHVRLLAGLTLSV